MSSNRENKAFLALVRAQPNFEFTAELDTTGKLHGSGTLGHLQAIIDARIMTKEDACRLWANSIGIAYVDVLASVIT
ncbi:MAG: Type secretion system protein, partial [Verrucomicrobiota bacterium]